MAAAGSEYRREAKRRRALFPLVVASVVLLLSAASVEAIAQLYIAMVVKPGFEQLKAHEGHYVRHSQNPRLGYELQPGYERRVDGRYLKINDLGFRGDEVSDRDGLHRLALLGDSVTFGIGLTQDRTIASLIEENVRCNGFAVINLGVPGYGVQEIDEYFKSMTKAVSMESAVYILNLNDFTLRNTIYEGADNGVYRMYNMPALKSPLIIRKAWYRLMKGDGVTTSAMKADTRWYRWLFDGTKEINLSTIRDMALFAHKRAMQFGVFILPAGSAYREDNYELQDIHDQIVSYFTNNDIPVRDGVEVFMSAPELFFDETDHLFDRGNVAAAADIIDFFRAEFGGWDACGANDHSVRTTSSPSQVGRTDTAERSPGP